MFNELPKLFDRNFAIGFFLPAAFLVGGLWLVLGVHGLVPQPKLDALDKLAQAVLAALVVWLLAIVLLALNYPILRLFEGYPIRDLADGLGRRRSALHTRLLRLVRRRSKRHARAALVLQRRLDGYRATIRDSLGRLSHRGFRRQARAALRLQAAVDAARAVGRI